MPAESKQEEPPDNLQNKISSRGDIEKCIEATVSALHKLNQGIQLNGEQEKIERLSNYLKYTFVKKENKYFPHSAWCIDHFHFVASSIYNEGHPLEGQAFPEKLFLLSEDLKNIHVMKQEERTRYAKAFGQFDRSFARREEQCREC